MKEYDDFELLIDKTRRRYFIKATSSPFGTLERSVAFFSPSIPSQYIEKLREGEISAEFLKTLGKILFNQLFPPTIKKFFHKCLSEAREGGRGLRLRLIINPDELHSPPWEFLYDEERASFLAVNPEILFLRQSSEIAVIPTLKISPPIKILIVISNPLDLWRYKIGDLDVDKEKSRVLSSLSDLVERKVVKLEFLEEATKGELFHRLQKEYHILHYIGHGGVGEEKGEPYLLFEDRIGNREDVTVEEFRTLLKTSENLRLVILDACDTASSSLSGAQIIQNAGIPAVVAMQCRVADEAASLFFQEFYRCLSLSLPVDYSISSARRKVLSEFGLHTNDWGVPVLYMNSRCGMILEVEDGEKVKEEERRLDVIEPVLPVVTRFVGRRKEIGEVKEFLSNPSMRILLIQGLAGIGKSTLVSWVVNQIKEAFSAVLSIRCLKDLCIEKLLLNISDFLKANDTSLDDALWRCTSLDEKLDRLIEALRRRKYLLILENFEELLSEDLEIREEGIKLFLNKILSGVHNSKLIINTRFAFKFPDSVGLNKITSLTLDALGMDESISLLARLGMREVDERVKEEIYWGTGGHPLALEFFRLSTEHFSIEDLLHDHSIFKMDCWIELLNKLYEIIPESEKALLESSSVFRNFFSIFALKWLGGKIEEMKLLMKKNLIKHTQGLYSIPPLIREFALERLRRDGKRYREIHSKAASFFTHSFQSSGNIRDLLEAHHHHFEAGEYESAAQIVETLSESLYRWGYHNLVKDLNTKVASTMQGEQKALALHRLGIISQAQGKHKEAIKYHEESLKIFTKSGAKKEIAAVKHELGTIHYTFGNYEKARSLYEESLRIAREIQDSAAAATTLHQLGMLYQNQGDYPMALAKYEQSLRIAKELDDESGVAATLSQLGTIYRELERYEEALSIYEECLKIVEREGDKSAIALTKWAIGLIYQEKGEMDDAAKLYKESLEAFERLGELSNLSGVLHQLGTLYQNQNVFAQAVEMYERSLKIKKEIGDRAGMAETLHQLGRIHHLNKEYKKAIKNYAIAASIFKEIKSPYEKIALNNLDRIAEEIGKENFQNILFKDSN